MINESLQVTFGVELEVILAFNRDFLRTNLLDTNNDSAIVKSIPDNVRRDLNLTNPVYLPERSKYMGWGLTTPTTYGDEDHRRQGLFEEQLAKYGYRGYAGEILTLAKTLLPESVCVHDSVVRDYTDYRYWHLTHDNSLIGMSKRELASHSQSLGGMLDDIDNWDSHGIELVTRVLPFTLSSFAEISAHLSALCGTTSTQHAAFATECCGLHVHVGLPTPADHEEGTPMPSFELPTLQHLAYILAVYEVSIRAFFPRSRYESRIAKYVDLRSNLEAFLEEDEEIPLSDFDFDAEGFDPDAEEVTPLIPSSPSNSESGPQCPTIPFHAIRSRIFTQDMTIEKLVDLMCGTTRSRVVNFQNVLKMDGPRTIELRQHEGTTDGGAVRWWATFVVGLVRLAEYMGRRYGTGWYGDDGEWEGYGGEEYMWREWDERIEVWDLLEMMEFPEDGKVYFQEKARDIAWGWVQ